MILRRGGLIWQERQFRWIDAIAVDVIRDGVSFLEGLLQRQSLIAAEREQATLLYPSFSRSILSSVPLLSFVSHATDAQCRRTQFSAGGNAQCFPSTTSP